MWTLDAVVDKSGDDGYRPSTEKLFIGSRFVGPETATVDEFAKSVQDKMSQAPFTSGESGELHRLGKDSVAKTYAKCADSIKIREFAASYVLHDLESANCGTIYAKLHAEGVGDSKSWFGGISVEASAKMARFGVDLASLGGIMFSGLFEAKLQDKQLDTIELDFSMAKVSAPTVVVNVCNYMHELTKNMLHAIREIHKRGIAHCDVNPKNIYVSADEKAHVRFVNFGLSSMWALPQPPFHRDRPTYGTESCVCAAPEILSGVASAYGCISSVRSAAESDLWGVGTVLAMLWSWIEDGICSTFNWAASLRHTPWEDEAGELSAALAAHETGSAGDPKALAAAPMCQAPLCQAPLCQAPLCQAHAKLVAAQLCAVQPSTRLRTCRFPTGVEALPISFSSSLPPSAAIAVAISAAKSHPEFITAAQRTDGAVMDILERSSGRVRRTEFPTAGDIKESLERAVVARLSILCNKREKGGGSGGGGGGGSGGGGGPDGGPNGGRILAEVADRGNAVRGLAKVWDDMFSMSYGVSRRVAADLGASMRSEWFSHIKFDEHGSAATNICAALLSSTPRHRLPLAVDFAVGRGKIAYDDIYVKDAATALGNVDEWMPSPTKNCAPAQAANVSTFIGECLQRIWGWAVNDFKPLACMEFDTAIGARGGIGGATTDGGGAENPMGVSYVAAEIHIATAVLIEAAELSAMLQRVSVMCAITRAAYLWDAIGRRDMLIRGAAENKRFESVNVYLMEKLAHLVGFSTPHDIPLAAHIKTRGDFGAYDRNGAMPITVAENLLNAICGMVSWNFGVHSHASMAMAIADAVGVVGVDAKDGMTPAVYGNTPRDQIDAAMALFECAVAALGVAVTIVAPLDLVPAASCRTIARAAYAAAFIWGPPFSLPPTMDDLASAEWRRVDDGIVKLTDSLAFNCVFPDTVARAVVAEIHRIKTPGTRVITRLFAGRAGEAVVAALAGHCPVPAKSGGIRLANTPQSTAPSVRRALPTSESSPKSWWLRADTAVVNEHSDV